jgi:hypothetical protein
MSRPPHPPWFNHPNNIRWRIQAVKFIIMQFYTFVWVIPIDVCEGSEVCIITSNEIWKCV